MGVIIGASSLGEAAVAMGQASSSLKGSEEPQHKVNGSRQPEIWRPRQQELVEATAVGATDDFSSLAFSLCPEASRMPRLFFCGTLKSCPGQLKEAARTSQDAYNIEQNTLCDKVQTR